MSVIKKKYNRSFTVLPNDTAQDPNLSLEAKGLLLFLYSMPESFVITTGWVMTSTGSGRDRVRRVINELIRAGYMTRKKLATGETDYVVSSERNPRNQPKPENPTLGDPSPENPTLAQGQGPENPTLEKPENPSLAPATHYSKKNTRLKNTSPPTKASSKPGSPQEQSAMDFSFSAGGYDPSALKVKELFNLEDVTSKVRDIRGAAWPDTVVETELLSCYRWYINQYNSGRDLKPADRRLDQIVDTVASRLAKRKSSVMLYEDTFR